MTVTNVVLKGDDAGNDSVAEAKNVTASSVAAEVQVTSKAGGNGKSLPPAEAVGKALRFLQQKAHTLRRASFAHLRQTNSAPAACCIHLKAAAKPLP